MPASSSLNRVLIADDDPDVARMLAYHLKQWRVASTVALNKGELLRELESGLPVDLVLLDVRFGEADGLELIQDLLGRDPNLFIVVVTAYGSIDLAISAIKSGARDFLAKPIDSNRLKALIDEAIEAREARKKSGSKGVARPSLAHASSRAEGDSEPDHGIIGASAATRELIRLLRRVAPTEANVLILGESGTGKEVVARTIHQFSRRHRGPFLPLNMAALPADLVESTLFGHEKGAFTGADAANVGAVESAEGGTLFLDEIGEMKLDLQAKLLRFLQERTFQRVGSSKPRRADVRIVAATNRNLMDRVKQGLFREDLYYRLNVFPIHLSRLSERPEDIPELISHFLRRICSRNGIELMRFEPAALEAMVNYGWPGNVRELENTVERLVILSEGPTITLEDVPSDIRGSHAQFAEPESDAPVVDGNEVSSMPRNEGRDAASATRESTVTIDQLEKRAIQDALAETQGNVRAAARRLGIGAATIYRKMKKYGLMKETDSTGEPIS